MEQPDIFISYAHLDNQPLVDGQAGWVTNLHRVLEKRLSMLLGTQPRIWRDRELKGNDVFDETIAKGVEQAVLFLPVLTPRYVKSDYCRKELEEFLRASARWGGLTVGDKSRVFKVLKTPVDLAQHPDPIRGLLGYEFYQLDPERNRLREFSLDAPAVTYREQFLIVLDDLAQEIGAFLQGSIAQQSAAQPAATPALPPPPASGATIYLATTTSDLKPARDTIRRELLQCGHTVLPDASLPLENEPFLQAVRDDLAKSTLAVHLVGEKYGFVPEDALKSSVALQLELAAEASSAVGLPRLIWMPPGLATEDLRQQELITYLRSDAQAQRRADLLLTSLEELNAAIADQLRPKPAADASPEARAEGPTWVYLMHDPRDADVVAPLTDLLWDSGCEVRTPLLRGDETELREEHEENLRLCEAFLIFYGQGNERWLRKNLGDLKRARGLGRQRPILTQAVYLAPPDDPQKSRFRTHEALVLKGDDLSAALTPFLQAMVAGAG